MEKGNLNIRMVIIMKEIGKMIKQMDMEFTPMSEEIVAAGGKMYIVSEYASNLYLLGKFRRADRIYATDITWFSE